MRVPFELDREARSQEDCEGAAVRQGRAPSQHCLGAALGHLDFLADQALQGIHSPELRCAWGGDASAWY